MNYHLECLCVDVSSRRTETLEAAGRILALSPTAQERVQQTLVNVLAVFARLVHLVARVGSAPVGSREVLTGTVTADVFALC